MKKSTSSKAKPRRPSPSVHLTLSPAAPIVTYRIKPDATLHEILHVHRHLTQTGRRKAADFVLGFSLGLSWLRNASQVTPPRDLLHRRTSVEFRKGFTAGYASKTIRFSVNDRTLEEARNAISSHRPGLVQVHEPSVGVLPQSPE